MSGSLVRAIFFLPSRRDRYILVTEDVPGQALWLHIEKPNLALTIDQKLRVASDLLGALEHAHRHGVIHRNITPSTLVHGSRRACSSHWFRLRSSGRGP